jgi:hypothetical protein
MTATLRKQLARELEDRSDTTPAPSGALAERVRQRRQPAATTTHPQAAAVNCQPGRPTPAQTAATTEASAGRATHDDHQTGTGPCYYDPDDCIGIRPEDDSDY